MNDHHSDTAERRMTERLATVLELQQDPDGRAARHRLAAAVRRSAAGEPVADDETAAALALLGASSLGAPDAWETTSETEPAAVADVLDRLDARDRGRRHRCIGGAPDDAAALAGYLAETRAAGAEPASVPAEGPIADWRREFQGLFRSSHRSLPELADKMAARGFEVPPHTLLGFPILDDPALAEAVVELLDGQWVEGGYRQLYLAARREWTQPGAAVQVTRQRVSGLVGAYPVNAESVGPQIQAPMHGMPVVRGRDEIINRLVDVLYQQDRTVQVLVGHPGYGKSTVALAVAQRAHADQFLALWVPALAADALLEGLYLAAVRTGATARDIEDARRAPAAERVGRLWALLDASPRPWLLVLDDAGAGAVGHPDWVHCSKTGTVLITTRFGDEPGWGNDAHVISIGKLAPEHGGLVVLDRIGVAATAAGTAVEAQARELSRRLDGMPLALTSAGRLAAGQVAGGLLGDLVERFESTAHRGPLTAIYEFGLQTADLGGRRARALLRLLACFAPDEALPVTLLDDNPDVPSGARQLLTDLVRVGLVEELPPEPNGQRCIRIHPAVAEHSRGDQAFDLDDAGHVNRQAINLLVRELGQRDPGAPASWPHVRMLEPHVAELVESPALSTEDLLAAVLELADRTSVALMRAGRSTAATTLLDRALERTKALSADHPARLDAEHARAWMVAFDRIGDVFRAETLLADLLDDKVRLLGRDHPSALRTEDCLAWVLAERGALDAGRTRFTRVLETRRRLLGERHPDTLSTRHRLAWVAALCGQEAWAAAELAMVLELRRQVHGTDHMDVYSTRYRLAWALTRHGEHAAAERQYRELQSDLESVLGRNHPMTLMVGVRVAWVLSRMNRFAQAERRYGELLVEQEKVLGLGHPRVLRTRHLRACLDLYLGRIEKAERELRAVAAGREEVFGADHYLTLDSRSFRAWALLQAGRVATARREFQAVLADRRRVQGERHPVTLVTRGLLAQVLVQRGQLADGERRLGRLLEDQTTVLGSDHRYVFDTRHVLAYVQGLGGRLEQSESGLRDVLADRLRVLGPDQRKTLATRDHLSWVLGLQDRLVEALGECESLLADRTRVLGPDHPHTLTSRYRTAWLVGRAGRRAEARRLLGRLLPDLRRVLGDRHPDVLRCRAHTVRLLRLGGQLEEAEHEARGVARDQIEIQGAQAVDSMRAREELGLVLLARGGREEAEAVLGAVLRDRLDVLGEEHPDTVRGFGFLAGASEP